MREGEMVFFNKPNVFLSKEQIKKDVELLRAGGLDERIDEKDFTDENKKGYKHRDIFNDQRTVANMEVTFEKRHDDKTLEERIRVEEREHLNEAFEVAVISGGQKAKWFGKNAQLIRSARFDDIFNGVDGFLEFPMEDGEPFRMALAIDASMSRDIDIIEKKMMRGIKKLESKKMEVKYFKSKVNDYKGKLDMVLPIVLGVETQNAQKLVHIFADFQRAQGDEKKLKKIGETLQNDPVQVIFLKEILIQLDMYAKLFRKEGSPTSYAVEKMHTMIENILKQKSHIESDEIEQKDSVFKLITSIAEKKRLEYQK
jgi:hypothetical protein